MVWVGVRVYIWLMFRVYKVFAFEVGTRAWIYTKLDLSRCLLDHSISPPADS